MATAANLESCSVGVQKGEACHKIIYCRVQELKTKDGISADDIRLIKWRTEISNLKFICLHHLEKKKKLTRYESLQKACCNPLQTHAKAFSSK